MKNAIAMETALKLDREIQCRLSLLQAPLAASWPPLYDQRRRGCPRQRNPSAPLVVLDAPPSSPRNYSKGSISLAPVSWTCFTPKRPHLSGQYTRCALEHPIIDTVFG